MVLYKQFSAFYITIFFLCNAENSYIYNYFLYFIYYTNVLGFDSLLCAALNVQTITENILNIFLKIKHIVLCGYEWLFYNSVQYVYLSIGSKKDMEVNYHISH